MNTVKREGFHSVQARVSRSKLALSSGVLECWRVWGRLGLGWLWRLEKPKRGLSKPMLL